MSCSMNTTVIFCFSQSSLTLSIIRQRSSVPMPAVGSSSSSTLGSSTSASAISSSFWSPCDNVAAVEQDLAGVRPQRAGDQVEERALAGAVGTDHGGERAISKVERDVVRRLDAAERFGKGAYLQHG